MVHSGSMQVERVLKNSNIQPSNVAISIFFETIEQLYIRVFQEICPQRETPVFQIKYYRSTSANSSIRKQDQVIVVKITDILEEAPAPVSEALAYILLSKLFRRPLHPDYQLRYRQWMNRYEVRRKIHQIRQTRGRKVLSSPQGAHYNLEEVFAQLNRDYFGEKLEKPTLSWSKMVSRTRLGHFDPSHQVIVISRILDLPDSPRVLLDYVMYHEMLHIIHPVELDGNRRKIHTKDFRTEERKFPEFQKIQKMLREFIRSK